MDNESDVDGSTTSAYSANNQAMPSFLTFLNYIFHRRKHPVDSLYQNPIFQDTQILVTIPGKLMLDSMLDQLGLPPAVYQRKVYADYKTCVTVIFQPSNFSCQASFLPMTISGVRSMDVSVAEHTAAIEAIRYVESAANTVVKDLNYGRLRQLEEENELLRNKLKDANTRGEKLARGWFLCVRHMCSFSDQFHNMAILSYFGGQEVITDSMKAAFVNIEEIAQRLKSIGARLETKLEGIRKFARERSRCRSSAPVFLVNTELRKGLHLALEEMTLTSHRIYDLAEQNRSYAEDGSYVEDGVDEEKNKTLAQFDQIALDLQRSVIRVSKHS